MSPREPSRPTSAFAKTIQLYGYQWTNPKTGTLRSHDFYETSLEAAYTKIERWNKESPHLKYELISADGKPLPKGEPK